MQISINGVSSSLRNTIMHENRSPRGKKEVSRERDIAQPQVYNKRFSSVYIYIGNTFAVPLNVSSCSSYLFFPRFSCYFSLSKETMKANLFFGILSIGSFVYVQAASVTFRVIAPGSTDVKVSINGQQSQLTQQDTNIPYFTGQAELADGAKYKVWSKTYIYQLILIDILTFWDLFFVVRCRRYGRTIRSHFG